MKKVLVFSILLITHAVVGGSGGKDDTKLTKTITKSFAVPGNSNLRIVNKYGPVVINTWSSDSVKLEINITAWGKNDKNVEKLMRRVDFDFIQSSRYLELITVLDRSSGFFTEVWNNIGDYSKTLLNQNKLKIEYNVSIPDDLDLEIENKFGDIYFQEYKGKVVIKLSHGNIRATKFSQLDLDLSFGNADIKSIRDGVFNLKAAECSFPFIGNGKINSSSSEVRIREISFLKMNSQSDRKFIVEKADEIQGTSNFSKIEIEQVSDDVRLELNYGELQMGKIYPGFTTIDVKGKNTPIFIGFTKGSSFNLDVEGKEDRIIIPQRSNLKKRYLNERDNLVSFTGRIESAGSQGTLGTQGTQGTVVVRSGNGDIKIIID